MKVKAKVHYRKMVWEVEEFNVEIDNGSSTDEVWETIEQEAYDLLSDKFNNQKEVDFDIDDYEYEIVKD
jgi:hypothetical protein